MSITILNGFESESPVVKSIKKLIEEIGEKFSYFELKNMNIQPCRSCGSCGHRTPGECIIDDEMQDVLRALAPSKTIIMLTPVRFGGYSSHLKKALDRIMLMGLPLYMVKDGHLLHPMRYDEQALLLIGVLEEDIPGQENNFRLTLERNALNMQSSKHKSLVVRPNEDIEKVKIEIGNALKEVI